MISLNRYHFLLYILVFILCFFLPLTSFSSDRLPTIEEYIRQIVPDYKPLSEEEFLEATKEVSDRPFSEDRLACSMRIKKDWKDAFDPGGNPFTLRELILLNIGAYSGEASIHGRSIVQVDVTNKQDIASAETAFRKIIENCECEVVALTINNDADVEALTVRNLRNLRSYSRVLIRMTDSTIFFIEYSIPEEFFAQEAAMQAAVIQSFMPQALSNDHPE